MTSADLERLHKYMFEIEGVEVISDEMREVIEGPLARADAQAATKAAAGLKVPKCWKLQFP
jgi:hypothetical protein